MLLGGGYVHWVAGPAILPQCHWLVPCQRPCSTGVQDIHKPKGQVHPFWLATPGVQFEETEKIPQWLYRSVAVWRVEQSNYVSFPMFVAALLYPLPLLLQGSYALAFLNLLCTR